MFSRFVRQVIGASALVLFAAGCSAGVAQAYLKKDVARSAADAYSFTVIEQFNNSGTVHTTTSAAKKTKLLRRSRSSFWYWENWDFAYSNNEFAYNCWMEVVVKGNSTKVTITLQHNHKPCGGIPYAIFYPATGELQDYFGASTSSMNISMERAISRAPQYPLQKACNRLKCILDV